MIPTTQKNNIFLHYLSKMEVQYFHPLAKEKQNVFIVCSYRTDVWMVLKRQEKEILHHNTKVIKACLRFQETCRPWNSGKQPVAITCCGGAQRRQKQASWLISHPAFSKSICPERQFLGLEKLCPPSHMPDYRDCSQTSHSMFSCTWDIM